MNENKILEQNVKKKKIDIKKTLRNFLVLVLVAVISIVGTLAYLNTLSNQEINTFSGSVGIKTELDEPAYDEEKAANYEPEMTIPKNPILTNTSDDADVKEWVAILVTYKYKATGNIDNSSPLVAYSEIQKVIKTIQYNTEARLTTVKNDTTLDQAIRTASGAALSNEKYWREITTVAATANDTTDTTKCAIYMYCRTLEKNETTEIALFDQVVIKSTTELNPNDNTSPDFYDDDAKVWNLPKFNIIVQGAAIKNEFTKKDDSATAATKWSELSTADQEKLEKELKKVFLDNNLIPLASTNNNP